MDPRVLRGKSIVSALDLTGREASYIIETGLEMKKRYYLGERILPLLTGRTLVLLFQAPSTRTRVSFEVAMSQLGGYVITLNWDELQLKRGETLADTARVLSRYADCIAARLLSHESLVELDQYADVPVINALSDLEHPVQALSDLMTMKEEFGYLKGLTVAFVGDGRDNVLNSLVVLATRLGVNVRIAAPRELWPLRKYLSEAEKASGETGAEVVVTEDPEEAVRGADVVYTDVWVSMGKEEEREKRIKLLQDYQVTEELMKLAKAHAKFMHCLPAHRGEEVTNEVIDGPRSIVWRQAENRLHLQKALLALVIR